MDGTETLLKGRYRIETLLGMGGMGAVYAAFDTLQDDRCAVKELRLESFPSEEETRFKDADVTVARVSSRTMPPVTRESAVRQFQREARILAKLDHPNLPKVFDYFVHEDRFYLVMELIEGKSLSEVIEEAEGGVPEQQVLSWMEQVLDAVDYCHSQGVIHRDIKPDNIIVTPEGHVYLVDFGIAKSYDPTGKTTLGARAVTPGYSPLEQYGGTSRTDARSDVYSLGALMYTLLTGRKPVEATSRALGKELPSPRDLVPAVSPHLDKAVMRALELDPRSRFQTVAAMEAALRPTVRNTKALRIALGAASLFLLFLVWGVVASRPKLSLDGRTFAGVTTPMAGKAPTGQLPLTAVLKITVTSMPSPTATPLSAGTPASAFTPFPTFTFTSVPTPTAGGEVRADVLNVRSGPGMNYPVKARITAGDRFEICGKDSNEPKWWRIRAQSGLEGWISADPELAISVNTGSVGISDIPPTPEIATPKPTGIVKQPNKSRWVLVADSIADYPNRFQDRRWWYLFTDGRNNFHWKEMADDRHGCPHAPGENPNYLCADHGMASSWGDVALQWKARKGGTYLIEWQADGDLKVYKHATRIWSTGRGLTLPNSYVAKDIIDWEMFFFVITTPSYSDETNTVHFHVRIYRKQ